MKRTTLITVIALFCMVITGNSLYSQNVTKNLDQLVDNAIHKSLVCLARSVDEVKDRALYPTYATKQLKWKFQSSDDWTSGFYPGCLWYAYELSKDSNYKKWAEEWTAGIERQKYNTKTHDLGFRFGCSFGNGLRLAPHDSATSHYKEILLTAEKTMDKRFFPLNGLYTSDWDAKPLPNSVPVVIDIMMNLECLMWASQHGDDPVFADHCRSHALNTYRDFIRADGGSFHVVRYDKTTGKVLNKGQLQGDVDSSTWSRGQSWIIYGMVTMYRYTKDPKYLDKAMRTADYFISHLSADHVAKWDFQSNLDLRDASATAVVTSALLEMQGYLKDHKKQEYYLNVAEEMLKSLCQEPYFSEGKGTNCLLLHSTQYYHATENSDVPCSFADYYFMESLVRYKAMRTR